MKSTSPEVFTLSGRAASRVATSSHILQDCKVVYDLQLGELMQNDPQRSIRVGH